LFISLALDGPPNFSCFEQLHRFPPNAYFLPPSPPNGLLIALVPPNSHICDFLHLTITFFSPLLTVFFLGQSSQNFDSFVFPTGFGSSHRPLHSPTPHRISTQSVFLFPVFLPFSTTLRQPGTLCVFFQTFFFPPLQPLNPSPLTSLFFTLPIL